MFPSKGWPLILLALCAPGCDAPYGDASARTGCVMLVGEAQARSIQYVLADVLGARVTVYEGGSNQVVTATFTGSSLTSHLSGSAFSFSVDNLPVQDAAHPSGYQYTARLQTYMDAGLTTPIGLCTSGTFTVTGGATPQVVTMPNLTLDATPVGSASATVAIVDTAPPSVVIR